MNLRRAIYLVVVVVLLSSLAIGRSIQKESESQTLVKSARFLEEKPLDKQAKDVRSWAITWIIQTDKVSVKACSLIISGVKKKYKYESELFGQYTIGMAAFKLAHPDKSREEDAAQVAGVESTVVTYQAILKEQPKAQDAFMDSLVAKRTDGTLADYVKANNCKDK